MNSVTADAGFTQAFKRNLPHKMLKSSPVTCIYNIGKRRIIRNRSVKDAVQIVIMEASV